MKTLISLLPESGYILEGEESLLYSPAEELCFSSLKAKKGAVFFCLRGARADGHSFAKDAYEKGVRAFFCEQRLALPYDALQIIVKNSRKALAEASAEFFSHPEKKLTLIGVTGTKGKSTVCEMISQIFERAGKKCAVIGTLGIKIDGETEKTENSTPESLVIYEALAKAVAHKTEYAAVEVSSQALCTFRVHGLRFAAAVFTNLTRDHVGEHEHPSFEHYKEAKKSLFASADLAFINADDPFCEEFAGACPCSVRTYGTEAKADVRAEYVAPFLCGNVFGTRFFCKTKKEKAKIILRMPGSFSALNALAAISVCTGFGIGLETCKQALEETSVRGRFEAVPCQRHDITCIIDYAHNAASLEQALSALRAYTSSKIICVFGSVGGRTKERRRRLGETAARLADFCIVTSDNPDFEDPAAIAEEIASHIPKEKCLVIPERAEAVARALDLAESGDILLFAGKGHEEYQIVRGKKLPFSERELIEKHIFKKSFVIPSP